MAANNRQFLDIDGRRVGVSNLDKPMYPSGFTKGQVIDYYVRVSDYLLPHIHNRPITMNRFPDGTTGLHFYAKDAPKGTPDWVQKAAVPRRAGGADIHYVMLNDLSSLVWAANLANLEIHPFLAEASDIERPLAIVFDLDPGPGVDVLACIEVAFLLKDALSAHGLESLAKVSGSKGMQLYAPLNTKVTYAETQPFARGLAAKLEREHPDFVITEMAKAARDKKVFIDWSQNSDFKTTVSVYSLRAKHEKPYVSLPFAWDEFRRAAKKKDKASLFLEPESALRRLEKAGDLFEPMLKLKQKIAGGEKRVRRGGAA